MKEIFQGKSNFIPPVYTDLSFDKNKSTMFYAVPVRNNAGKVIAVLTFIEDPQEVFTEFCQLGKVGKTGEIYAIDEMGALISNSRFEDQLTKLKLLEEDQVSLLNLEVRDPGENLEEGYQPVLARSEQPLTLMAQNVTNKVDELDIKGYRDYRGVDVFGIWQWNYDLNFGLAVKIDREDALSSYYLTRTIIIIILIIVALLAIASTVISLLIGEKANKALRKYSRKLEAHKDHLEEEVEKRTAELAKAEEHSRLLLESVGDGILGTDTQDKVTFINSSACKMLGYSSEKLLGMNVYETIHHSHADGSFYSMDDCPMKKAYITGSLFSVDDEVLWHKDGTNFPVEYSVTPIGHDETIVGSVVVFRDITERKRAEEALHKSEEEFRVLYNNAPDMYVSVSPDDAGILLCNDTLLNKTGYSREEVIGSPILKMYHDDCIEEAKNAFQQFCKTGKIQDKELILKRKDGSKINVSLNVDAIKDNTGKILHSMSSWRDITDRKQAEETIKKSENRFRSLFENSPIAYQSLDENGCYLDINEELMELLGYTREEILGKQSGDFWTSETQSVFPARFNEFKNNGKVAAELAMVKKDGTTITVLLNGRIQYDEDGKFLRTHCILHNISERKQMEEELKIAKERAEDATQAKSDFLANMSHEIRTPMNAIIGMSYLALRTDLNPKQHDYLKKIDISAKSLLSIINDILDFSKIEAGKLDIEVIDFDLNEVLVNLSNLISLKAHEKGLELVFAVDPEIPETLQGDPLRLGQILLNLTGNAIKFTEKGEIVVSVKPVKVVADYAVLHFSVKDTGIGLTEAQRSKLFQSFEQADTSITRKYGGTGLGLIISKKLTEMMGGKIDVKSEYGKGTTFFFTARFERQKEVKTKSRIIPEKLQGFRVLVVDNSQTVRKMFKKYLEKFGFHVRTVPSGNQAVDEIKKALQDAQKPYDLVFMDWKMPGMDGIKTAKRIQNDPDIIQRPEIIITTGYDAADVMNQAHEIGLDKFLLKPFSQSQLFDIAMDALGLSVEQKAVEARGTEDRPEKFDAIRGARILLVEDNEINQQVAVELLQDEGFFMDVADNGKIAVEKVNDSLKDEAYDVVLMDLQMPVMDGYTSTKEIRKDSRFKDLPIIAMTADAMSGVRDKVLDVGMNDYVTKPINPDELFSTLVKWIKPSVRDQVSWKRETVSDQKPKQYEVGIPDALPGIEIKAALDRVAGNQSLFRKLLTKFCANHGNAVDEIVETLESGDRKTAIRLTHTLKGISGTIGAWELHEAVRELEAAIKDQKEEFNDLLERVSGSLKLVISGIVSLDESQAEERPEGAGETVDISMLIPLLDELKKLLEEDDMDAVRKLDQIKKVLKGSAVIDELNSMEQSLGNYDSEKALEELAKVVKKLKGA